MSATKVNLEISRRFWTVTLAVGAALTLLFLVLVVLIHVGVVH